MKDLIIKNVAEVQSVLQETPDTSFYAKPVIYGKDIDACAINFIEIPPGKHAWPYHYHDQSEEIFYIISGQGKLRSFYGEKDVKPGDILCFPNGKKGGHLLFNTSETEMLVYVDFEVKTSKTDIVTMPDEGKFSLIGNHLDWTDVDIPNN